jgi:hypothetical protein
MRFLRKKVRMTNSGFRTDQVGEIVDAIRVLSSGR